MNFTSASPRSRPAPTLAEMADAMERLRSSCPQPPEPLEVTKAEWDALKGLLPPYTAHSNAEGLPDSFMGVRVVLKD